MKDSTILLARVENSLSSKISLWSTKK